MQDLCLSRNIRQEKTTLLESMQPSVHALVVANLAHGISFAAIKLPVAYASARILNPGARNTASYLAVWSNSAH